MDQWSIVCEKGREAPISWLEKLSPYKVISKQITVGDYAILHDETIIVTIERKTWKDLADTIKDPKRKANHQKLLDLRSKTNCSIIYIIEGTAFPGEIRPINKVPFANLQAMLDHIMIRDNCHVIQTPDIEGTAKRIISLVKSCSTCWKNLGNRFTGALESTKEDNSALLNTKHVKDDVAVRQMVFLAIKGITIVSLPAIEAKYKLVDLLDKSIMPTAMGDLKYASGGKFGPKRAKVILRSAESKVTHCKMLAEIPGVTKDTANKILAMYELLSICKGEVKEEDLALVVKKVTISKSGNVKNMLVGKAVAKKIYTVLVY